MIHPSATSTSPRYRRTADWHGKSEAATINQRSRAEAQIGRWKSVIGPKLRSRRFENQKTEAQIGVRALNRMTELGCARFESVG